MNELSPWLAPRQAQEEGTRSSKPSLGKITQSLVCAGGLEGAPVIVSGMAGVMLSAVDKHRALLFGIRNKAR